MLRRLKTVATRAGMDPDTCWLHKFRATFATHALQGGIDLRTVQSWMGHTDLASTMRYLGRREERRRKHRSRRCWLTDFQASP
jgi:site-specific recombinase XerD